MGAVRTPLAWILTPLLRHPCARAFREEYAPEVPEHGTDNDAFTLKVYYPSDLQPQETEILRFEDRETGDSTVRAGRKKADTCRDRHSTPPVHAVLRL